jgi:hypothetical protein
LGGHDLPAQHVDLRGPRDHVEFPSPPKHVVLPFVLVVVSVATDHVVLLEDYVKEKLFLPAVPGF